jgi:hypothetical protein
MGVALFERQFAEHSHSIAKRHDDAVVANQLERQWRGAKQSVHLSNAALLPLNTHHGRTSADHV